MGPATARGAVTGCSRPGNTTHHRRGNKDPFFFLLAPRNDTAFDATVKGAAVWLAH